MNITCGVLNRETYISKDNNNNIVSLCTVTTTQWAYSLRIYKVYTWNAFVDNVILFIYINRITLFEYIGIIKHSIIICFTLKFMNLIHEIVYIPFYYQVFV